MQNVKTLNDTEIEAAITQEWLAVLTRLWDAIGKPVDMKRLMAYKQELGDIPLGLLEDAVSKVLRDNDWNTVPTIGAIWKAVEYLNAGSEIYDDYIVRRQTRLRKLAAEKRELAHRNAEQDLNKFRALYQAQAGS